MIFNKIDAFTYTEKDKYDLRPAGQENISLAELEKTWMASHKDFRTVFISAVTRENIEELRKVLYEEVKRIHVKRYPFNEFLYETGDLV